MSNIFLKIISIKTDTLSYNSNLLSLSILRKIFVDLKVQNYSLLKSMGDVKCGVFFSSVFGCVCSLHSGCFEHTTPSWPEEGSTAGSGKTLVFAILQSQPFFLDLLNENEIKKC